MTNNGNLKIFLAIIALILVIVSCFTPLIFGHNINKNSDLKYNGYYRYFFPEYYNSSNNEDIFVYESDNCIDTKIKFVKNNSENIKPSKDIIQTLDAPISSPWPMRCFDARHTGRSPYNTINTWGEIWRIKFNSLKMLGSPAIDINGTIYCSSQGEFFAVNPNGTLKWKYKEMSSGYPWCTPAIDDNNTIYFGTIYGDPSRLYALNPDGSLKWKINGKHIRGCPTIGADGTIYYADAYNYNLRAANPNGTIKWTFHANHLIYSDIAIGLDGTLYFGTIENGKIYAVYPNGTLRWSFNTGTWVHGSASIGDDGTVYIGSDRKFYAFYPNNGTLKWQIGLGAIWSTPVIDNNGIIYVGSENGKLYALYPNGTIKWKFSTGGHFWFGTSPALSAEGEIYFGTTSFGGGSGNFFALYPNGEEKWRFTKGYYETSPAIGKNGIVYITSCYGDDGALHAFGIVEVKADSGGPYYGLINEPVQFNGKGIGGYSPLSYHWDFGDGHTSEEHNPMHIYTENGNYSVTLTVIDDTSNISIDTTYAWIQNKNAPPDKPVIDGPVYGIPWKIYDYKFVSTDPEGTPIYYYIDWDDPWSENTGWIGPYNSGKQIIESHGWAERGTYIIRCKAKDPYGEEGEWGELKVTMTRNKDISLSFFLQLSERFPLLKHLFSIYLL